MPWLFADYFGGNVGNVLSIGCGDGLHELGMARNGWAKSIDAFDISSQGIAKAKEAAATENLSINFYCDNFENFLKVEPGKKYDAVMFLGSLHHVKDIDAMLGRAREVLTPNGALVLNEYIGPCFNIYDEARISIINGMLDSLDNEFKVKPNARWSNPSFEHVMATDPSEAVRSALIPQFVRLFFKPEIERFFGGAILHPIFDHLNSIRLNDGSAESASIVRLIIEFENMLTAKGVVGHDFVIGVYRPI